MGQPGQRGDAGSGDPSRTNGADAASWSAEALDVLGPAARGRREASAADGDRGLLWIADGSLFFAGRRSAWTAPLSWLAPPETDLSGLTQLRIHTADRGRAITLRFRRGADDEFGLAEAVRAARTGNPDPRDRRALEDFIALLRRALDELQSGATAPQSESLRETAARLNAAWMPYWGAPASRLRDATIGALLAIAEAGASSAPEDLERRDQALRRWQNVCEDLADWCGIPAPGDLPPLPELQVGAGQAAVPEQPAGRQEAPPTRTTTAAQQPAEAAQAAPQRPETPWTAPAPGGETSEAEQPGTGTLIINAEELRHYVAGAAQREAAPAPQPAAQEEYDDRTVLTPRIPQPEPRTPAPSITDTTPTAQAVVTGPGRKGSGGMTMLYRRSGPDPRVSLARKELQPEAAAQPDVERIFLDIGRRFQQVRHPNFVHIVGSGIDPQTRLAFIEMEFVEGESVSARQRSGALPPQQVFDIADQLAAAIDAVHAAGLTHGDVRPQNVLIEQPSGRIVLLEPSVAVDHELEHRRGTIYGELPFLTLERVRGESDVPSSDTYALGLIAYALLTGKPPWTGEPAEIFMGHEDEAPPPIESRLPGAPPAANEVFAMALAKRPADRPMTATAFAAALRNVFGGGAATAAQRPAQPPQQPPPARPAPGPLGRSAPSPLGARTPPPEPPDDEPPDDERTIIVRPR